MDTVSIIIPVFNLWEMTKNCLDSIVEHTDIENLEIIVIDNASSDATFEECEAYGKKIFGESFYYLRQDINKNFAPACNIGAKKATGEFLLFLNNDIIVTKNWLPPLLSELKKDPLLGGVGPVLLYPELYGFKDRVQHLGVTFTPFGVRHLYEGIPAAHPLVKKKRYFQAITGAAFLIRKSLFEEVGRFDEVFINGFEDVELCVRIVRDKKLYFSCTHNSIIYHLTSQTPGRHDHEDENAKNYSIKVTPFITPDELVFANNDGLFYDFTPYLKLCVRESKKNSERLNKFLSLNPNIEEVMGLMNSYPFWEEGYYYVAEKYISKKDIENALNIFFLLRKFFFNRDLWLRTNQLLGQPKKDLNTALPWHLVSTEDYIFDASINKHSFENLGLDNATSQCSEYLNNIDSIRDKYILAFIKKAHRAGLLTTNYQNYKYLYSAWIELKEKNAKLERLEVQNKLESNINWPKVSVLIVVEKNLDSLNNFMSFLNGYPTSTFELSVKSVIEQSYPFWELFIVGDVSNINSELEGKIKEIIECEPRVKVGSENNFLYSSVEEALKNISGDWVAFVEAEDLLSKNALFNIATTALGCDEIDVIYSDLDLGNGFNDRLAPFFKPAFFDKYMSLYKDYINSFPCYKIEIIKELETDNLKYKNKLCDLFLRSYSNLENINFRHIPKILLHKKIEDFNIYYPEFKSFSLQNKLYEGNFIERCDILNSFFEKEKIPAKAVVQENGLPCSISWELKEKKGLTIIVTAYNGTFPYGFLKSIANDFESIEIQCFILPVGEDVLDSNIDKAKLPRYKILQRINSDYESLCLAYNQIIKECSEKNIAIINGALIPYESNLLKETVACLGYMDIACCGGKLWYKDTLAMSGLYPSEEGIPFYLCKRQNKDFVDSTYYNMFNSMHVVLAPSAECFFFTKESWEEVGGFDAKIGNWFIIKFCEDIRHIGKNAIHVPWLNMEFKSPPENSTMTGSEAFAINTSTKNLSDSIKKSKIRNPNFLVRDNLWEII